MRFAAIGLDHRHIYHMVGELIAAGATCAGYDPSTSDLRAGRLPGALPPASGRRPAEPTC